MPRAAAIVATAFGGALCGALLGLPWAARFAAIAPLTLFPLFYAYRRGQHAEAAWLSALFEALSLLVGLAWIYGGAVTHQGVRDYYISAVALVFQIAPYALAGFAASFASRCPTAPWCITVAGAWTLCEFWRATSPIGIPYVQLGHALIDSPLVAIARVGGTEALTFLAVLVAAALFETRTPRRRIIAWALFGAIVAANAAFQTPKTARLEDGKAVTVFQLGLIDDTTVSQYASALQATPSASALAIWPELALRLSRYSVSQRIRHAVSSRHIALLVGGFTSDDAGTHDALEFIGSDGNVKGVYAKRQLVPFGEYLPLPGLAHVIFPASLTASIPNLSRGRDATTFDIAGRTIGALLCYESAFPALARASVAHGANLLVAATNDAWFTRASGVWELDQSARLVAIETGTPIVLAGSVGPSGVIDGYGRWTGSLPVGSVARGEFLLPAARPTIYDAVGDLPWIVAIAMMICIACAAGVAGACRNRTYQSS